MKELPTKKFQIASFGIGSKITSRDSGFVPANLAEFIHYNRQFYSADSWKLESPNRESKWYDDFPNLDKPDRQQTDLPDIDLSSRDWTKLQLKCGDLIHSCDIPKEYGKGEWEAKTLHDAKQMAINFARSVSSVL